MTISDDLIDRVINIAYQYTLDQANPAKALSVFDEAFACSECFNKDINDVSVDDILEAVRLKYNINVSENKTE